jgi:hypothetical protein
MRAYAEYTLFYKAGALPGWVGHRLGVHLDLGIHCPILPFIFLLFPEADWRLAVGGPSRGSLVW